VAIWRAIRIFITKIWAYIFSMAWSIENMESHLYRVSLPILLESLMESSLNILREIVISI
jgi:hypothetical protein